MVPPPAPPFLRSSEQVGDRSNFVVVPPPSPPFLRSFEQGGKRSNPPTGTASRCLFVQRIKNKGRAHEAPRGPPPTPPADGRTPLSTSNPIDKTRGFCTKSSLVRLWMKDFFRQGRPMTSHDLSDPPSPPLPDLHQAWELEYEHVHGQTDSAE